MKTIKVIDLLNKIANGEEVPKKIKYEGIEYTHIDNYCYADKNSRLLSYEIYAEQHRLNDEIEIIEDTPKEDKKIEKFKVIKDNSGDSVQLVYDGMKLEITLLQSIILDKINEIIDYINKLEKPSITISDINGNTINFDENIKLCGKVNGE